MQKTDLATQSILAEAFAFKQGASAIEAAQENAKIAPFQKQVDDITELISAQKALGASESQLKDQMSSLADAQEKLNAAKNSVHSQAQAEETRSLNETSNSLTIQIEKLGQYTSAILNGAEAVRQFNIAQQVQAFAQKNPLLSADQLEQYRQKLEQVSDLEQIQAAAEKVAGELNYTQIEKQIAILEKMRQQVKEGSDEQKAIDAVLHKDRQQELSDYDNLLAQSGKLSDGFKLFFTEYANNAKTAAQQVNDVMTSTMNSLEGSLTKFITGQKNAFKGLGTAIEQSLAKTAVQDVLKKAVGGIGSLFGVKTPGAKRDGNSKSNALYVTNVPDGAVSAAEKAAGGLLNQGTPDGGKAWDQFMKSADLFGGDKQGGSLIGKMTGGFGSMFKGIGSIFSSLGGTPFGSIFKGLGSFLGSIPGLENGGSVSPGKAYVVGEKRPELFLPSSAGRIVPNFSNAPAQTSTTVNAHFHGVTDMDGFKKSQNQIASTLGNSVQNARMRGR